MASEQAPFTSGMSPKNDDTRGCHPDFLPLLEASWKLHGIEYKMAIQQSNGIVIQK
jgi:hypothetical protein